MGFQGQGIQLCSQITETNDNKAHGARYDHPSLCRNGKTGLKLSVYTLGQQMMCETIGFQGQGIQLCNQITEINDNYAHGAPYDHQPLCRNKEKNRYKVVNLCPRVEYEGSYYRF